MQPQSIAPRAISSEHLLWPGNLSRSQSMIRHVCAGRRLHTLLRRANGSLPAAHAIEPVCKVQRLDRRGVVALGTARALAKYPLARHRTTPRLGNHLITAAVEVQSRFGSHQLRHRRIPLIDKRALKVELELSRRIVQER